MTTERVNYAAGTYLEVTRPWGICVAGAALCADGKVRRLARISDTADTFFSVPAAVKVRGRTVSGYVTVDTANDDTATVYFLRYDYGRNADALPAGKFAEVCAVCGGDLDNRGACADFGEHPAP